MHLYFIRHGESESNYGELITGQQDVPLTQNGRDQASLAGRTMAEQGLKIDHIICSPLIRARDTARLVAKEIGYPEDAIAVNPLIIERSFGSLEGTPNTLGPKLNDELIHQVGGELDADIRVRAQAFLDSLKSTEGTVLVVSHTGFGRRLRAIVENISTEQSSNFKNADLTDLGEI